MSMNSYVFDRPVGRVLFKREYGGLRALKQDLGTAKLAFIFSAAILTGSLISILVPVILRSVSDMFDIPLNVHYFRAIVAFVIFILLMMFSTVMLCNKKTAIITDMGIMYGNMFQRWDEIRDYQIRHTKQGMVILTYSRHPARETRMYFNAIDSDTVERFFIDYLHRS